MSPAASGLRGTAALNVTEAPITQARTLFRSPDAIHREALHRKAQRSPQQRTSPLHYAFSSPPPAESALSAPSPPLHKSPEAALHDAVGAPAPEPEEGAFQITATICYADEAHSPAKSADASEHHRPAENLEQPNHEPPPPEAPPRLPPPEMGASKELAHISSLHSALMEANEHLLEANRKLQTQSKQESIVLERVQMSDRRNAQLRAEMSNLEEQLKLAKQQAAAERVKHMQTTDALNSHIQSLTTELEAQRASARQAQEALEKERGASARLHEMLFAAKTSLLYAPRSPRSPSPPPSPTRALMHPPPVSPASSPCPSPRLAIDARLDRLLGYTPHRSPASSRQLSAPPPSRFVSPPPANSPHLYEQLSLSAPRPVLRPQPPPSLPGSHSGRSPYLIPKQQYLTASQPAQSLIAFPTEWQIRQSSDLYKAAALPRPAARSDGRMSARLAP